MIITDANRFRITLDAEAGFRFTQFGVSKVMTPQGPVDIPLSVTSNGPEPTRIVWEESLSNDLPLPNPSQSEPIPAGFAYQVRNWRMKDASNNELNAGATEIQVTPLRTSLWRATPWGSTHPNNVPGNPNRVLHVQVLPSDVRGGTTPPPVPCFSECDPTRPRFPVSLPWLHEDPTKPGQAADPRVLALALLYSVLAVESARTKAGTPQAVESTRRQVAAAIYTSAWKLFFATIPDTERFQLTEQAWCCAALSRTEVSLRAARRQWSLRLVSGGHIQSVDPWGGRRWVVHYPLVGATLHPPSTPSRRIFSPICCRRAARAADRATSGTGGVGGVISDRPWDWAATCRRRDARRVNLGRAVVVAPPAGRTRIAALGLKPTRVTASADRFRLAIHRGHARRRRSNAWTAARALHGARPAHLVAPGDPERSCARAQNPPAGTWSRRSRNVPRAAPCRRC